MKADNTPTVTARRRDLNTRKRLRVETAKDGRKKGRLDEGGLDKSKEQTAGENDEIGADKSKEHTAMENNAGKVTSSSITAPRVQTNVLATPPKPPSKFRKRQINKSWLPTHVYHAKRAHMTPPTEPLWRHAIPLTPTDKCHRATHRAVSSRGCVAWDTSYMSTIGAEGVEASLVGLLRGLGVEEAMLEGKAGNKWRRGTRGWEGWISERDGTQGKMARVTIIWDVPSDEGAESYVQGKKKTRKIFLRVHPSAFFQVWNEILKVAKIQRPPVMVEDLRFEIGSIEVIGPGSTEALTSALRPLVAKEKIPNDGPEVTSETKPEIKSETEPNIKPETKPEVKSHMKPEVKPEIQSGGKSKINPDTKPEAIWPCLRQVTNPACLPPNALLGFEISDPRLHHPPRTVKSIISNEELLQILATWPPDKSQTDPSIFDRKARLTACRLLSSQKSINRRKGNALPGAYSDPLPQDPRIPVLLSASAAPSQGGQSSWTVLLPWKIVLPVWHSLMYYPLTTGENPRFGGLQERRQISFEQGISWFPGDFPGTKAGWEWERMEREKRKAQWEKRPKGKRVSWESVDLGNGTKGEIGIGWACDWERLFRGMLSCSSPRGGDSTNTASITNAATATATPATVATPAEAPRIIPSPSSVPQELPSPPLEIHQVLSPISGSSASPNGLMTISITLISRGNPTVCARIYRLPTTNPNLREAWIAQTQTIKKSNNNLLLPPPPPNGFRLSQLTTSSEETPPHIRRQKLAAALLASPPPEPRQPGSGTSSSNDSAAVASSHPHVPGEEDLIGFVTTGNFDPSLGRARAIGCVALARVENETGGAREGKDGRLCIVRDAGQSVGRLGRWDFV